MFSFKSAELFMRLIIVLLVYFITAPLVGYSRAWTADEMGDTTPEQLGFLTLDPMAHISLWWVFFILWVQIFSAHFIPVGLGKHIPINPNNIQGSWRGLKLAFAYLSDSIASIVLGIGSFFILIVMFGADALVFLERAVSLEPLSLRTLTLLRPDLSSMSLILVWFVVTFALFNCLVAAFSVISNLFHFVVFYYFEDQISQSEYGEMILMFGPLLFLYLMIFFVWSYVTAFVVSMAYILAMLVGMF